MLTVERFQEHCTQLIDPNISAEARKDLAVEVRDSIELVHSQEYRSFLAHFLPAFNIILTSLTVPQCFDNSVHKTRAIILEILSRLPHTDTLRERLLDVFNLAMNVLQRDNEENAATAIHIIFDLHKNSRQALANQVQPFLDFVRQLYESFGKTVELLLLSKPSGPTAGSEQRRMPLSTQSFKLITECPLLVMFVFQLYPANIEANIRLLKPLMVRAIELEVQYQGVAPSARGMYQDLVAAQVKTVSFLAYLLKQNPDFMRGGDMSIPRSVVKLLQACPGTAVQIRKELLVATRHILSSPYRQGFFDQIDVLLDERVLVGTGRAATEQLRPLGYSFLAELVHCVRQNLSIPHLEKIIFLYSTNVHDPSFSYSLQTSAVRLLMNLIEGILKISSGDVSQRAAARELLIRILDTMVAKYVSLGDQVPRLLKIATDLRNDPDPIQSGKRLSEIPVGDPLKEVAEFKTLLRTLTPGLKTVIWTAMNIRISEATFSRVSDGSHRESVDPQSGTPVNIKKGLAEKECETVSRLLAAGQRCFRLYSTHEPANGGSDSSTSDQLSPTEARQVERNKTAEHGSALPPTQDMANVVCASPQEEREIFDQFAQIFTVLDVGSFQDVFGLRMADLFDHIVANPQAIAIPQHFLANSNMSKYFADILLNFLVDNLSLLDVPQQEPESGSSLPRRKATALLRMFKILFASVSLFPANEPVLRLHLATIVQRSLKFARDADDSHAYLQMLRAFFKAITSGKHESQFDVLYKDFMPLVEPLFDGLLSLYSASRNKDERELIAELCLMMPARPSTIFPYLEKQLKPIVWALQGVRENPTYGLRTLEFWVDMLQPSYLDILLHRMEPDLTRALLQHLRPADSDLAKSSLRILGKLGSRSREFQFSVVPNLCDERLVTSHEINLQWTDGTVLPLETSRLISLASETLLGRRLTEMSADSASQMTQSWLFLRTCLHSFIPAISSEITDAVKSWPQFKFCPSDRDRGRFEKNTPLLKSTRQAYLAEDKLLVSILTGLLSMYNRSDLRDEIKAQGSIPGFKEEVDSTLYLKGFVRYFAALVVQDVAGHREDQRPSSSRDVITPAQSVRQLSPSLFSTSVIRTLCLEQEKHFRSAKLCLQDFTSAIVDHSRNLVEPHGVAKPVNASTGKEQDTGMKTPAENEKVGAVERGGPIAESDPAKITLDDASSPAFERVLCRALADLIEQLCHCCHKRNWASKRAGAFGLNALIRELPVTLLSSQFFRMSQHHVIRALLTIVRSPMDLVTGNVLRTARSLLQDMLKHFPVPRGVSFDVALSSSSMFKDLIMRIGCELVSESTTARLCARESIRFIANSNSFEVIDLLKGSKDQLLRPLHTRQLRQQSLALQVSYVECFNFFLESGKSALSSSVLSAPLRDNLLFECMFILEAHIFDSVTEAEEGFRHKNAENKYDSKTTRLLLVLRRRIMELLCNVSVYCSSQLQQQANERLFRGMISCFFKSLQSGDVHIVDSAKRGLKQAISKHPKPKELLQQNLRPILGYLADYKKLSIPYLQGLSRVLELFSHWFNVNLGDKLLEHLQRWTEPEKFAHQNKWTPGTESKVGAAILDLFHLLPPAAQKFLPQIVQMVVKLEAVLPVAGPGVAHLGLKSAKTSSTSPYRAPLLRYCNQHASIAANYFLGSLADERTRQLFFVLLRATDASALRKEVAANHASLAAGISAPSNGIACRAFYFIGVIDLVSRQSPEWLCSEKHLLTILVSFWNKGFSQLLNQVALVTKLCRIEELDCLGDILIRYCKQNSGEKITTLFELLSVFSVRTVSNFSNVKDYLRSVVETPGNYSMRRSILIHFLGMFQSKAVSNERKTHALQHIVVPMISTHLAERRELHGAPLTQVEQQTTRNQASLPGTALESTEGKDSFQPLTSGTSDGTHGAADPMLVEGGSDNEDISAKNPATSSSSDITPSPAGENSTPAAKSTQPDPTSDEVFDSGLLQRIMKEILDQPDDVVRSYDELLSAQLLHLATELIRGMPKELERSRKELIKFGWGHLKREDSIAKQWAFVNVTRFFEAYQAPPKIILQVYVALLRVTQSERRELVQQALDILTPALPRRLVHQTADHRYPIWIRYTKKILLEEGHSIPNLVHIWQLIVRHPKLFYVARAQFVPIMANSLSKIGLFGGNSAAEYRRLALDLVDLIVKWEKHRRSALSGGAAASSPNQTRKRERNVSPAGPPSESPPHVPSRSPSDVAEPPNKLRKMSEGSALPTSSSPAKPNVQARDGDEFCPALASLEAIMNFLVQVPFRPTDRRDTPLVMRRCFDLIDEVLKLWPEVNARLGFIEKVSAASQQVPSKPPGSTPTNETGAQDPKAPRNDAMRSDRADLIRADLIRSKRIRASFLTNALHIFSIFVRRQGKSFVDKNAAALKAVVSPSIADAGVEIAEQFSGLLENLLLAIPYNAGAARNDTPHPMASSEKGITGSLTAKDTVKAAVQDGTTQGTQPSESVHMNASSVYVNVHEAVDVTLRSNDPLKNLCGLYVLEVFVNAAPNIFSTYQDSLTKLFHRLAKEQVSSISQSVPSLSASVSNTTQGRQAAQVSTGSNTQNTQRPSPAGDAPENTVHQNGSKHLDQVEKQMNSANEVKAIIVSLSLLGKNIQSLESVQRKAVLAMLCTLIDRSGEAGVLLKIIKVVSDWVFCENNPSKDPFSAKEKSHFLIRMTNFERIPSRRKDEVMGAFLRLIVRVFGGDDREEKKIELVPKLERAFMLGLKSPVKSLRDRFFSIYDNAVGTSTHIRLNYIFAKQDWEHLADTLWVKHAVELLLSPIRAEETFSTNKSSSLFPELRGLSDVAHRVASLPGNDERLCEFITSSSCQYSSSFTSAVRNLVHVDSEFAFEVWGDLVPKLRSRLSSIEKTPLDRAIPSLLSKEYHQTQVRWAENNIQALLKAIVKFRPVPYLNADVVVHLGSRWNAWHSALKYLDLREDDLRKIVVSKETPHASAPNQKLFAELQHLSDCKARLYSSLQELDFMAGVWKTHTSVPATKRALALEQTGFDLDAQDAYADAIAGSLIPSSSLGDEASNTPTSEVVLWEDRWVECAVHLCQWDILTEFSRSVVNSSLLHECLWRLPDWSGLRELLAKCPVPDSPELKLYQAYVHLQENKLEMADSFINQGYQKALEKVSALPPVADLNSLAPTLVQFQKLVELQESSRVFAELNSLSRSSGAGVNIEQKIDNVKGILNCWRERVPSQKEPLYVWNEVLTWRNHMHAVVVNVLEALKDAANAKVAAAQSSSIPSSSGRNANGSLSHSAQVQAAAAIAHALPTQVLVMGVNETAWNVHRFAKTCRKQGYPDVALFSLQKLYPFGTMDLSEYFVKTKETVRSYMAHPRGLEKSMENGLHELNRCNVDHFNARQKAQLFVLKAKLLSGLGHVKESREALLQAVNTSPDVGGAWLEWGRHCDARQMVSRAGPNAESRDSEGRSVQTITQTNQVKEVLLWREAAANCYLQAARFGSRKARPFVSRVLRLLSIDMLGRGEVQPESVKGKRATQKPTTSNVVDQGSSQGANARDQKTSERPQPESMTEANQDSNTSRVLEGVAKCILGLLTDVPSWLWLPWISQMLNMLSRAEAAFVMPVLARVGEEYPQAIFYALRAYMEERKPHDKPTKLKYKEILKQGGPIIPAPRSGPTPSAVARQTQLAKDSFNRTNDRYVALRAQLVEAEKVVNASQGTADHSANVSRRAQIKSELLQTHRVLERCIQAYRLAHHRQTQLAGYAKHGSRSPAQSSGESQTSGTNKADRWTGEKDTEKATNSPAQSGLSEGQSGSQRGNSSSTTDDLKDSFMKPIQRQMSPFDHADLVMARLVRSHYNLYLDMERMAMELSFRLKPQREEHLLSLMSALLSRCYQAQMKNGKEVAQSFITALIDVSRMCFNTGLDAPDGSAEQRLPSGIADLKSAFEKELAPQTASDFPRDHEALIARLRRWQGIFQGRVNAFPEIVKLENVSKHLLDIDNSSIEVFGQYVDAGLVEPSPDKHVKIMRFGADIRVVSRPASLSRGLVIIGSDGRDYHFVLESGGNGNVQAAEERISQLFRLINSCLLSNEARCARKRLQLHPPKMIATGFRSRLTLSSPNSSSLSEALQDYLEKIGKDVDDAVVSFRRLSFDAYNRLRGTEEQGLRDVIASRIEAYDTICEEHVPENVLRNWVGSRMRSEGHLFLFRKRFAESVASGSIASHCLGVGARRPVTMLVDWESGVQSNLHMRALTSPGGVIESDEAVPFRLTRNIANVMGENGVEGPYFAAMGNVLRTMLEKTELVVMMAEVVLRDELSGWAQVKAGGSAGGGSSMIENRLQVSMERIKSRVSCRRGADEDVVATTNGLIELARKKENLAHMETTYQAWY